MNSWYHFLIDWWSTRYWRFQMAMEYLICGFSSVVFFSSLPQIDSRIGSLHIIRVGGDGGIGWWQWTTSFIQRYNYFYDHDGTALCAALQFLDVFVRAWWFVVCVCVCVSVFFSCFFYSWATELAIKLESIVRICHLLFVWWVHFLYKCILVYTVCVYVLWHYCCYCAQQCIESISDGKTITCIDMVTKAVHLHDFNWPSINHNNYDVGDNEAIWLF